MKTIRIDQSDVSNTHASYDPKGSPIIGKAF